jgi:hypothetical protein
MNPEPDRQEFVGPVPRAVVYSSLVRLGTVLVCAGAVALVYGSVVLHYEAGNRKLKDNQLELAKLGGDVAELQMRWDANKSEAVKVGYQAAQQLIFTNAVQLREWQNSIVRQAPALALTARIHLEAARPWPGAEQTLAYIPARIDLGLAPVKPGEFVMSPFARVLQFTQALEHAEHRFDIFGLYVQGEANSVKQATYVVRLLTDPKEVK